MPAAVLHGVQLAFLIVVERSRKPHQQRAGESDDRVEWRAQFVAHAGEEVVLGPAGLLELDVLLAQLLLDALAVGDVADGGGDDDALSAVDRRQRDLGRELGAVAATSGELHPSTHRARARVGDVPVTALGVQAADGLGDEQLDGLADQLVAGVAEQPLGLGVDEHDLPVGVDADDRVRRGFEQAAELRLGALAIGDVAYGGRDHDAVRGVDGRQRDLRRELGAIAAAPGEFHPGTHRAGPRIGDVPGAALRVARPDGVGDEQLDRLADEFAAGVAEQPLGLGVDEHDLAAGVDPDDRVRRSLQQADRELIWPSGNDEYRPFYVALTVNSQSHTVRGHWQTMNVAESWLFMTRHSNAAFGRLPSRRPRMPPRVRHRA